MNYRTPIDLAEFIASYEANQPDIEHDVWLVNVSPNPDDLELGERAQAKHRGTVHHLVSADNIGYARACNGAARHGDREVVALLNADIVLTPDAMEQCAKELIANDDWGVLGPRQVDERGKFTHAGIFGTLEAPLHRGWHHRDDGQYSDIRDDAVTVAGSAYFIRRTLWQTLTDCPKYRQIAPDAIGAFLPTPHYAEETWCSYHAHAHGWKRVYFGSVAIVHKWHRASPVGGHADQQFARSMNMFRAACDVHDIPHN